MTNDLEELKKENERLIAELSNSKKVIANDHNKNYVDELLNKGILLPRQRDFAIELLDIASSYDNGEFVAFSEGESLTDKMKDFLAKQLPINLSMQTDNIDINLHKKPTIWRKEEEPLTAQRLDEKIKNYMRTYNVNYRTAFNEIISLGE
ncbi:hypothetical protein [Aggregatibacter actinomycetemcomitans]|uniref:hypothetical protein n=1 Tax=Aggregatibacter actinomycetemcomitans TaxID=714 RepID=UPI00023FEEC7|nr:hypothetical protein [Aggregatibacter actinomycetemcomitans]EHK90962.1 hypothetical protein RHAA1_04176 [Aggregatibacter actinomycetemcomitans RhAA1]KNE77998.1 hypothetical protein RHAA2_04225 [Aggregatibacter actinomycetemcomitans RhAA1]MBN6080110.1 hypothetical protein [Aggregatibacter actinomycetemcomitans]